MTKRAIVLLVKRNWVAILGILISLYLAMSLKNGLKDLFQNPFKDEIDDPRKTTGATLTPDKAKNVAEMVWTGAMSRNPLTLGTDFDIIKRAFGNIKNLADWNMVYNAFGLRQYSMFWGNEGDPLTASKRNMIEVLLNELTDSQIDWINTNHPYITL